MESPAASAVASHNFYWQRINIYIGSVESRHNYLCDRLTHTVMCDTICRGALLLQSFPMPSPFSSRDVDILHTLVWTMIWRYENNNMTSRNQLINDIKWYKSTWSGLALPVNQQLKITSPLFTVAFNITFCCQEQHFIGYWKQRIGINHFKISGRQFSISVRNLTRNELGDKFTKKWETHRIEKSNFGIQRDFGKVSRLDTIGRILIL